MLHTIHCGNFCKRLLVVWCVHFTAMDFLAFSQPPPCPVTWGPTVQISNTPSSAFVPQLAVVGDTVHVVYDAGDIYYRRSLNAGSTWDPEMLIVPDDSIGGMSTRAIAAESDRIYYVWGNTSPSGAITSVKILRSTDAGETWLAPQILVRNEGFFPLSGPIVAVHGEYVYVRMGRFVSNRRQYFLTVSSDRGETWDSVRQITFVAESHNIGDIVATASGVHLVFEREAPPSGSEIGYMRSTDSGATWSDEEILSTIDTYQAWWPRVAADDAGNVYVSWQDAKYGSINGFTGTLLVRRSTDNGLTWQPEVRLSSLASALLSSIGLANNQVHAVWGDERAGTANARVYYVRSTNAHTAWCEEAWISDTTRSGGDPTVGASGNRVYVAWSSHGTIRFRAGELPPTGMEGKPCNVPTDFWVSTNYPNPFNRSTHVQYTVPNQGKVLIAVYDVLGRRVETLHDEIQSAGFYQISFDGSALASGIYYLQFRFNTQIVTRTVVLMR